MATIKKMVASLSVFEIIAYVKNSIVKDNSNATKNYRALQFIVDNASLLDYTKKYSVISTQTGKLNTGYICELIVKALYNDNTSVSTSGKTDMIKKDKNIEIKSILNPSSPSASLDNELDKNDMFIGLTLNGIYEISPNEIKKHLNDRQCFKIETNGKHRAKAYLFETYGKLNKAKTSKLKLR